MAGHLRNRGNDSWQLVVHLGFDETGRRTTARRTFHGGKREAERALAMFVSDATRGTVVAPTRTTLAEVVNDWLAAKSARISPSTVDRYRIAIKHLDASVGRMPVGRVRTRDIEELYARLHHGGMSGASIRKLHWALRQSLAWAKRQDLVATLATEGVELPPLGAKRIVPPTSESVGQLLRSARVEDPEFGALFGFMAWTGCRRGEAAALRWNHLDLERGQVLIERSLSVVPYGLLEKSTKTGHARRLALGPSTVQLLLDHRLHREEVAAACGTAVAPDSHVFSPTADMRTPWHPQTISHRFLTACKRAGVTPMRLHDLRHHSATALLKSGVSVGEVMDRHGWKTMDMVSRYRHLMEATDVAAAEALERLSS